MSIRVEFIGVCTHIMRKPEKGTGNLHVPHRVVLVNARKEVHFDGTGTVPAHEAKLRIRGLRGGQEILGLERTWTTWRIHSAMLTIAPVREDAKVEYTRNWNLPRIENLHPKKLVETTLGPGGDPEVMVACFDVKDGIFEPVCHDKAHGAVLTVNAGSNPRLVISPLGTPGIDTSLELNEDAEIQLLHIATEHKHDHANHFYLHYLIAGKQLPPDAQPFKDECGGGGPTLSGPISLGPDCSNSSYP